MKSELKGGRGKSRTFGNGANKSQLNKQKSEHQLVKNFNNIGNQKEMLTNRESFRNGGGANKNSNGNKGQIEYSPILGEKVYSKKKTFARDWKV